VLAKPEEDLHKDLGGVVDGYGEESSYQHGNRDGNDNAATIPFVGAASDLDAQIAQWAE
jgi:hypothetical protein